MTVLKIFLQIYLSPFTKHLLNELLFPDPYINIKRRENEHFLANLTGRKVWLSHCLKCGYSHSLLRWSSFFTIYCSRNCKSEQRHFFGRNLPLFKAGTKERTYFLVFLGKNQSDLTEIISKTDSRQLILEYKVKISD